LIGPKYLRYVPNADHSLGAPTRRRRCGLLRSRAQQHATAQHSWTVENDNACTSNRSTSRAPSSCGTPRIPTRATSASKAWAAVWKSEPIAAGENGTYIGKAEKPPEGWTAFMVELTYPTAPPAAQVHQRK